MTMIFMCSPHRRRYAPARRLVSLLVAAALLPIVDDAMGECAVGFIDIIDHPMGEIKQQ
jgi:hypothetical protein